jgi:hypothetical protein
MVTIDFVLIVVAFVCFVAAAAGVSARVNLVAAGLALWVLTLLV